MSMAAVRLAMMERFAEISGVEVPADPLPHTIDDKTIVVFPRIANSTLLSKGRGSNVATRSTDIMQVEYHRRIPYEHLGSTMGDITTIIQTLTDVVWSELAGGKFDGTVFNVDAVNLVHLGRLGWNEWTFGARLEIVYVHLTEVAP